MKASLERCMYSHSKSKQLKNFQSFENHSVPYRKVLSQSNDRAMLEIKAFQEVSARRLSFAKA